MALTKVLVPALDPQIAIFTPTRAVEGIVKSRAGVLDAEFEEYGRWLCLNASGSLSYVGWDDVTVSIPNLSAGVFHPIYAKKVNSSGTTATQFNWGN